MSRVCKVAVKESSKMPPWCFRAWPKLVHHAEDKIVTLLKTPSALSTKNIMIPKQAHGNYEDGRNYQGVAGLDLDNHNCEQDLAEKYVEHENRLPEDR